MSKLDSTYCTVQYLLQVCVQRCPEESYSPLEVSRRGVESELDIKEKVREFCSSEVSSTQLQELSVLQLVEGSLCPSWYLASQPVLGRCLPVSSQALTEVQSADQARETLDNLLSIRSVVDNLVSDLAQSCWLVALCLSAACLLSLLWILLLRCLSGLMVWLSILAVISLLLLTLVFSATRLHLLSQEEPVKVCQRNTVGQ